MDARLGRQAARRQQAVAVESPLIDAPLERPAISDALTRLLAVGRIATWEWIVAAVALFFLGRTPILFLRFRLGGLFGGRPSALWQDDLVVLTTFVVVLSAMVIVAIRRANIDALLAQPMLLAVIAFVWLSMSWSVEPVVTLRRAALFAATAIVGWYIGDRFPPKGQARLVVGVAWIALLTSIVALVIWPDLATATNSERGQFSGMYVNRNALGLVLSGGLLASVFVIWDMRRKTWFVGACVMVAAVLVATKSRTGPVGLISALVITFSVHWLRKNARPRLTAAGGAVFVLTCFGTVGYTIHYYWFEILGWLGRDASLTTRTGIWDLVRYFSSERPWLGWGFEAIWANPATIGKAQAARGAIRAHVGPGTPGGWPYAAHNGYFEMLLGVGRLGLLLFLGFLVVAGWRAFEFAWHRRDMSSLWPLAFIVFVVVVNFSESTFVSSEALWALTVAAAVGAREWGRRQDPFDPTSNGRRRTTATRASPRLVAAPPESNGV